MRYKVGRPLENGKRVSVFDLRDTLYPEEKRVFTQLPIPGTEIEFCELARAIDTRMNFEHPALPRILDITFRGRNPGLVTRHREMPTLEKLAGNIPLEKALRISVLLADLMCQLHHRNVAVGCLNPRKIFITREGYPILNFLVTRKREPGEELSGCSLQYASPEYVESGKPTIAGDCYSMGMVFYCLFTGRVPFQTSSPEELALKKKTTLPALPDSLRRRLSHTASSLIESLLYPDPRLRPSARQLLPVFSDLVPGCKCTPAAISSRIIGREYEISRFNQIARRTEASTDIVLVEGEEGTGKSRLCSYFQLTALLRGYEVRKAGSKPFDPETNLPGSPESVKLLLCLENPDSSELAGVRTELERARGRTILLIESKRESILNELQDLLGCGSKNDRIHLFHLENLDNRKTKELLGYCLGNVGGCSYSGEFSEIIRGNPSCLFKHLENQRSFGKILWQDGSWVSGRTDDHAAEIPETIRETIGAQIRKLNREQLKILKVLAVIDREIPFSQLNGILNHPMSTVTINTSQLEEFNLVKIDGGLSMPRIKVSFPWISALVRKDISHKESERIHRKASLMLEDLYLREQKLPLCSDLCGHYLERRNPGNAAKHLTEAIDYLTRNSLFHKALRLFEASLSRGISSTDFPENWLTYIKLLLKTGKERQCREFLETPPGFSLGNTLLFRLGYILDSLDLSNEDICPHLSTAIEGVYSQSGFLDGLRISAFKNHPGARTSHILNFNSKSFSRTSIHEKTRCFHHLYRMYRRQGRLERALSYEVRAFRLSLSLGKKAAAARRLLNLAEILILEEKASQAESWLKYCLQMADETGDMKTRLMAQVYLTRIDREEGRHLKAEYELAAISAQNNRCCGSSRIAANVLIEEAGNLAYRAKYEQAISKISRLTPFLANPEHTMIREEAQLLEAGICIKRKMYGKALAILDMISGSQDLRYSHLALRAALLKTRTYLEKEDLTRAGVTLREILSLRAFLSPRILAKTRILQAELSLAADSPQQAETFVNHALRISRGVFSSPLKAQACLVKARCLMRTGENRRALQYYSRAICIAEKMDRPELELKARLIIREENSRIKRNFMSSTRGVTNSYISFLMQKQDSLSIGNELLKQVRVNFPESTARLYPAEKGIVTSPGSQIFKLKDGEALNPEKRRGKSPAGNQAANSTGASLAFSIGTSSRPCRILKVDFPDGYFVSEPEFDFIKHLADLAAISLCRGEESSPGVETFSADTLRLLDGREIIGSDVRMQEILKHLVSVADMETTVLLQGESGTGKELMARALHDCSLRKTGPFIPVNCAALPPDLVENELFGHIRGSYTGADFNSEGVFEAASGGTIFLDEISTLSLSLQPRLLRVIENKTVRPLGAAHEKRINVRIVAATNQNLEDLVRDKKFRQDLFFRLNAFRIEIPPLRKRKTDILRICDGYLRKHPAGNRKELSEHALAALTGYDYPGNVRELLNIMENLICFTPSRVISEEDVRKHLPLRKTVSVSTENLSSAGAILLDITHEKIDFWEGVRNPFINREINRSEVRHIIAEGLRQCGGSYKKLLKFFNLKPGEYKKFLSFLEHHGCKVDFREFRGMTTRETVE